MYLGRRTFQEKNWEGAVEKVSGPPARGRGMVPNNLAASTFWHRLVVLPPPRGLMEHIPKKILDFFWYGQHWLKAPALYLPVDGGGQALIDVASRVMAFRLQTIQRLCYRLGLEGQETENVFIVKNWPFWTGQIPVSVEP